MASSQRASAPKSQRAYEFNHAAPAPTQPVKRRDSLSRRSWRLRFRRPWRSWWASNWHSGFAASSRRITAAIPDAGFTPQVPHFHVETNAAGEALVTVVPNKRESVNDQTFPRHKKPGTYRIVCLGGSATYGRPFFDHTSFAGWLRAFLPKADPSRKWEVINAGAISYASYRVKGLMAELAQYEPDLFIAYMGHNEFLEPGRMLRFSRCRA